MEGYEVAELPGRSRVAPGDRRGPEFFFLLTGALDMRAQRTAVFWRFTSLTATNTAMNFKIWNHLKWLVDMNPHLNDVHHFGSPIKIRARMAPDRGFLQASESLFLSLDHPLIS